MVGLTISPGMTPPPVRGGRTSPIRVNDLLSVRCSKDLGSKCFRTSICNVGKP